MRHQPWVGVQQEGCYGRRIPPSILILGASVGVSMCVFLCVCAGIHERACHPHTNIVKVLPGAAEYKEP